MPATLKNIAAEAGLSVCTVSRILSGHGSAYRFETRRRVTAIAARLGYRPNLLARAVRGGRTGVVALVLPEDEGGTIAVRFLSGLCNRLGVNGMHVILHGATPVSGDTRDGGAPMPLDGLVDAVIVTAARSPGSPSRAAFSGPIVHAGPLSALTSKKTGEQIADRVLAGITDGVRTPTAES